MKQYDLTLSIHNFPRNKTNDILDIFRDNYKAEERDLFSSETCITVSLSNFMSDLEQGDLAKTIRDEINNEVGQNCGLTISISRIMPSCIYEYNLED